MSATEQLYRRHATRLQRAVRSAIYGPDALIEDACSYAWLQLVRAKPNPASFGWLYTVAIRQAWELSRRAIRECHLDDLDDVLPDVRRGAELDQTVEANEALVLLAGLPDRQRCYLTLHVSGYSYAEIANRCDVTYTNVDKHLSRGRRALRGLRC